MLFRNSDTWSRTDPDELSGTRISTLLAPGDWDNIKNASQRLQEDESRTVEVRFKLHVEPEDERESSYGKLYQLMEGKGMLMFDREDGQPTHTMWVVKPIAPPRYEQEWPSAGSEMDEELLYAHDESFGDRHPSVPITPFPFNEPFSTDLILCRICETRIPQWYFEKHSETCVEVHRLEAEIAECNESISELRNTIRDLCSTLDGSSPGAPEYRGMPIFSPSTSPIMASPLQLFRVNKIQRMGVKKIQRRLLDQLDEILQVALEVSIPSLKEEESKEPIERQRLLSPSSERNMSQVRNWNKPTTQDAALGQLVQDAERVMRQKIDNVVRMQNTIRYSEKIWHEWEEKVEHMLAAESDSDESDEGEEDEGDRHGGAGDDTSSTNSEFALDGDAPSSEPTPMASSALINSPGHNYSSPVPLVPPPTIPRQIMHTRSSTPSSVSSPLALAAPIIAPSSPEDAPPHMSLDDGPATVKQKSGKSTPNIIEPKLLITPPMSPKPMTRETSFRRAHRRHSTACNSILSPTSSSAPLSPRQHSVAPLSRATPTSIKDFDIIKPISKGAFGSVFLAKKKVTGDYYAIKVLKKADMIAKNQITNVKAERMILMKQAESPFVAKLYFTFQSKENLYLVMEYLNGGDCAALIKSLGSLPEEWTKNYIAEVVLGLEYLHQRGVVHRSVFSVAIVD
jgi:serine/threonine-protein kinase RIM15